MNICKTAPSTGCLNNLQHQLLSCSFRWRIELGKIQSLEIEDKTTIKSRAHSFANYETKMRQFKDINLS